MGLEINKTLQVISGVIWKTSFDFCLFFQFFFSFYQTLGKMNLCLFPSLQSAHNISVGRSLVYSFEHLTINRIIDNAICILLLKVFFKFL